MWGWQWSKGFKVRGDNICGILVKGVSHEVSGY
jgi:hypothetical protein